MRFHLLLSLLLFAVISYGQETCNNSVDDDADGLIDLNDPDCVCTASVEVPSLIPNPSFEDFNSCPSSFSQLSSANSWIQASLGTSDYFNTCGYVPIPSMLPFPDGQGAVGGYYCQDYKEYVGACLLTPMIAGTTYQLQFDIASIPSGVADLSLQNNGIITYGPLDITLYGTTSCASLPVNTLNCITEADPNWIILGTATYTPSSTWGILTITFTPAVEINTIILGSPCQLPPDYPLKSYCQSVWGYYPYFYFDDLTLNVSTLFNTVSINSSGDSCDGDIVLHSQIQTAGNYTYQWYVNGVAIANANSPNYTVENNSPGNEYSVMISDAGSCFISSPFTIPVGTPLAPNVDSPVVYCQNETPAPLSASGSNLLWYTSPTGGTGSPIPPIPSTTSAGTISYYVSQTCALESPRVEIVVIVNALQIPNFPQIAPICIGEEVPELPLQSPNGIAGTWNPAMIDNTQSGTYTFQPNDVNCSENQIMEIAAVAPDEFIIEGGCRSNHYILEAVFNEGVIADFTFQWQNELGNIVGLDENTFDVTENIGNAIQLIAFPITYTLTATNEMTGCRHTANFVVNSIFCDIPKGVSVNGDSANDFFNLMGLNVRKLSIYNRYGIKVYSKDNYKNEWNGQTDDGKTLPDGTYYYLLTFDDEKPKTGWVYLSIPE